ncbi:MAG: metalloregulator ArsR/SmtB family transcription factor [Flavipsychrobacter sp.]|nr:metalloregulator ArsR/SmtB family transcription factor [Flavipsychrobacter sp.]
MVNDVFQAIADPSRREILLLLSDNSRSINALAENFTISRPAVSKHIKVLYDAGFIEITAMGRERMCKLKPDGFEEVKKWIVFFDHFWTDKLSGLEKLLDSKFSNHKVKNK